MRHPIGLLLLVVVAVACSPPTPRLDSDIPADLARLVEDRYQEINRVLAARSDCLAGLTITHSWEMADRASYDPETATITLRVPATARELEFSLVHELAHHFEAACTAQQTLRPAFLLAQGHPEDAPWFEGETWETTPSEQFASALGVVVTGEADPGRRVPLTDAAVEVVAGWVAGS